MEPAPASNWSPSPTSVDSSPVPSALKRPRENGQEADLEIEPLPKKAFGFEMKLSTNLVRKNKAILSCIYVLTDLRGKQV